MKKWCITLAIVLGNLLLLVSVGRTGFELSSVGVDTPEARVVLFRHYTFTLYLGIAMILPSLFVFDLWYVQRNNAARKAQ
jgi:hypothetical protein